MGTENKDFLKELRAMFRVEADEHLSAMSAGTLELKKGPSAERQAAIVENAFREVHSLKGAARSVDMADIEAICQATESVFSALKRKEIKLSPELFETLDQAIDTIANLVSSLEKERSGPEKDAIARLIRRLAGLVAAEPVGESSPDGETRREGAAPSPRQEPAPQRERLDKTEGEDAGAPAPETSEPAPPTVPFAKGAPELPETVRISISKLDSLLLQAEEMLSLKLTAAQQVAGIRDVTEMLGAWRMEWAKVYPELRSIRKALEENAGPVERLQTALPLAKVEEFADWDHAHFKSFEGKLTQLASVAESDRRNVEAMVDKLAEDMKKTLMLPFSILLEVFPRFVRELSRDQGKDVELIVRGGDTEIDRRILEEMKDPLVHLIRNCIDHGIEKPKDREQMGKPPRGTTTMAISHVNGNQIEILVSDDGKGIDTAAVKDAAVKRGVLSKDAADDLSEQDALSLVFQSDVSTSPIITDISGRGLGLAIVQDKVGMLDGFISLETKVRVGTLFRIVLPLTLATFRGILVRVADKTALIPTSNVERVARIRRDEIVTVESRETIQVGERVVPLVRLDEILNLPRGKPRVKRPISYRF